MKNIQIKNYDVVLVKIILLCLPIILTYAIVFFLVWIVDDWLIEPFQFLKNLFGNISIGLFTSWVILISISVFLIKKNKKVAIKDSITMNVWMSFKTWVLTLGDNFESK